MILLRPRELTFIFQELLQTEHRPPVSPPLQKNTSCAAEQLATDYLPAAAGNSDLIPVLARTLLAYAAYQQTLDCARSCCESQVKHLLLAQKSWTEGNLALLFYAAQHLLNTQNSEALSKLLLPIINTCCSDGNAKSITCAMQVHSYCCCAKLDYALTDVIEQNAVAINSNNALAQQVLLQETSGLAQLMAEIRTTIVASKGLADDQWRRDLRLVLDQLDSLRAYLQRNRAFYEQQVLLSNAMIMMDFLGRITLAWIWLKQATIARSRLLLCQQPDADELAFYRGKLRACQYFFHYQLPHTKTLAELLMCMDTTCVDMEKSWF